AMTSNEAAITLHTQDGLTKEESYQTAGQALEAVMGVENVREAAIVTDKSIMGFDISQLGLPSQITSMLDGANSYGSYQISVL
ncbi:hypothetical protein RFZ33_03895, partial [Acinetobacter baumannii]|nr:hypothetical protein [Acinetobacter baumannii]